MRFWPDDRCQDSPPADLLPPPPTQAEPRLACVLPEMTLADLPVFVLTHEKFRALSRIRAVFDALVQRAEDVTVGQGVAPWERRGRGSEMAGERREPDRGQIPMAEPASACRAAFNR